MRFGPSSAQRDWHPWFAWHPVQIGTEVVWLETIERRWYAGTIMGYWQYRNLAGEK